MQVSHKAPEKIKIHAKNIEKKDFRFEYSKGHNPAFIIWEGSLINSHTVTMDYL